MVTEVGAAVVGVGAVVVVVVVVGGGCDELPELQAASSTPPPMRPTAHHLARRTGMTVASADRGLVYVWTMMGR